MRRGLGWIARLAAPLGAADGPTWAAVFGGLALLVIYLYQGSPGFAAAHWLPGAAARGSTHELLARLYQFAAAFVLLFALPMAWGLRWIGWRDLGLGPGDWRFGVRFVLLGVLVLTGPLYVNAGSPEFRAEYPLAGVAASSVGWFLAWEAAYLVYYVAWEGFFRGFWQLGLARGLGVAGAMALQVSVSTVMHIGKPEAETAAAIAGGLVFGLVALRTRSIWYVTLLHWYVGMATDLFCILRR